ncbi:DUF1287 domain-containing protein [Lentibacter algarum]|uniref:DUF1287 domain-containing protein n=1 Tax=Lentibacter algarum TaxID=576131 RepID=UPI001C08BF9A|nr:DUF1287 domain-containing protein [Lentibacter algarum]MBU2982526.1 DUF1287 domain-containing protein [Lentibacter algarum]
MFLRYIPLILSLALPLKAIAQEAEWGAQLVANARQQVGITTIYDPAYVVLEYPMGDLPRERGVCSDVVIRALRDSGGIDLQKLVHEDMKAHFKSYPTIWALKRTDKNIDHRRVPNLERFFERKGMSLPIEGDLHEFVAGDIVSWRLPRNLPHIGIVSDRTAADGTPLVIHNIGAGTRETNILFTYQMTGHYRPVPAKLE